MARQRHKELVTDEMLNNEMAILAPLHEACRPCRQRRWPMREPGPSGKSTWSFKAKLRDQYLEGKGVDGAGGEPADSPDVDA